MTAHARRSDPVQSHAAVAGVVADTSLAGLILWACAYHNPEREPLTDDDVLELMEARTGRRFQRNVIARARGRLMNPEDGPNLLEQCPDVIGRTGRPTICYRLPAPPEPFQLQLIEGDG